MVLSGTAADAVAAERAMAIATGSVPKGGTVVNAMNVAGPQQVMLEVRFLEVARTAGRELGVNLYAANANGTNVGNTGLGAAAGSPGGSPRGHLCQYRQYPVGASCWQPSAAWHRRHAGKRSGPVRQPAHKRAEAQ